MSNSRLNQFRYSYEAKIVDIYMNVSIGASGAPTLTSGKNKGIVSIARNGAGDYTITLKDRFQRLVNIDAVSLVSTTPASPVMSVKTDSSSSATPTVRIIFSTGGVATDPASGEVLLMHLAFSDSTAF